MSFETVDSIQSGLQRSGAQQDQPANGALTQKFASLMRPASGVASSSSAESGIVADAANQALRTAKMNADLAAIGQQAAAAAAALKLQNDLNDATVNFTKNVGSSVKAAAQ